MWELTHIKGMQQETHKRPVSIWLSFQAGCGVCGTTSLFPFTSTRERQDLFCQQHLLKPTEKLSTPSLDPATNCQARALHKDTKENPNNSKDKEKLNWVQLDISHSFPTIVLTSI